MKSTIMIQRVTPTRYLFLFVCIIPTCVVVLVAMSGPIQNESLMLISDDEMETRTIKFGASRHTNRHVNHTTSFEGMNESPKRTDEWFERLITGDLTHQPYNVTDVVDVMLERFTQQERDKVSQSTQRNVLFIMADDFRPVLGVPGPGLFGGEHLITPNLDNLARESLVLTQAFAQYSLCGPSRVSLLTSRDPLTTGVWGNDVQAVNFTTIPEYFQQHGFDTRGFGKIYHGPSPHDIPWHLTPDRFRHPHSKSSADWEVYPDDRSEPLDDEYLTTRVIRHILQHAKNVATNEETNPFLFMLGFRKPHLPFLCREKFFGMYDLESADFLPYPSWRSLRPMAMANLLVEEDGSLGELYLRQLRRAYFACRTYVDDLIGELMRALELLGLLQSTIVLFTSDHGHHLGENEQFGKCRNVEASLHVPFILRVPGRTDGGIRSHAMVELLDVLPSLVDATGLGNLHACPKYMNVPNAVTCTDGKSVLSLVDDPTGKLREYASSIIVRDNRRVNKVYLKFSMRNENYRFSQTFTANTNCTDAYLLPVVCQLFDVKLDPLEATDLSENETYIDVRNSLIRDMWSSVQHKICKINYQSLSTI